MQVRGSCNVPVLSYCCRYKMCVIIGSLRYTAYAETLFQTCRPNTITEFGPLANPRLCVFAYEGSLQYKCQVLFTTIASGEYSFENVQPYLDQLTPLSGYKLCIPKRFVSKRRIWGLPFNRLDSRACLLWHIPNNAYHPQETHFEMYVLYVDDWPRTFK